MEKTEANPVVTMIFEDLQGRLRNSVFLERDSVLFGLRQK